MQVGTVIKANRSSGKVEIGGIEADFDSEGQHKKKNGDFVPVPEGDRYFPKRGKQVRVIEVSYTGDGPRLVRWALA